MPELWGSTFDISGNTVNDIIAMGYRIVIDTNVFASAKEPSDSGYARSRRRSLWKRLGGYDEHDKREIA